MSLIELNQIKVSYGMVKALNGIDLMMNSGEIVCLLGGNASGKSTTMKTILGLVHPTSGAIRWDGHEITTWPTPRRIASGIASVPEARRIFGPMTVEENLLIGAYTCRDRHLIRQRLAEQYDRFPRLAERRAQTAGTMSGGEQQMLAFARALMSGPRLICMDEPTMGLSPKLVDEVLASIADLNRDLGITILMVEQQAELALSIAHRGYVLATGDMVLSGEAAELLDNPRVQEAYLGRTIANGETE